MQFIIDFIDSISSMISGLWDFFGGLIQNFIQFFEYIGTAAKLAYNLVNSLPTWLSAFGLATVLISVIFMILGRSTGGQKSE